MFTDLTSVLTVMPEIKAVAKSAPNARKDQPEDVTSAGDAPVTLFADQPERVRKINELRKLIQSKWSLVVGR